MLLIRMIDSKRSIMDCDANVILCSCTEYLSTEHTEARVQGLVKVPGQHIVSIFYKKIL